IVITTDEAFASSAFYTRRACKIPLYTVRHDILPRCFMVKSGLALLAAMLLSAVCLAQDAPARPTAASSRLKAPVTVSAAGEEFFSQPSVEEGLQRILHPEKITHRKPFELGTAFRTLGEAAQAGINPLEA